MKADVTGLERQLEDGLIQLGLTLTAHARAQLLRYLGLLQKWNRVYNLTAIRQPGRLVSHHLLDSLSVLPHLPGLRLIDVGSGAGLPGIPLAIARPDWEVVLLDSNHKKGAFLRQALIELELPNVQVATTRAEEWHTTPARDDRSVTGLFGSGWFCGISAAHGWSRRYPGSHEGCVST